MVLAVLLAFSAPRAAAMIFYASGDTNYTRRHPPAALTNSGWQWQGNWRGFGGTPIGTNLFLTAQHVGGHIGDIFSYNGTDHRVVAAFADSISDLMIWQVCGTFPSFAPLYTGTPSRSTFRVLFSAAAGPGRRSHGYEQRPVALRGWAWGETGQRLRWGRNTVSAIVKDSGNGRICSRRCLIRTAARTWQRWRPGIRRSRLPPDVLRLAARRHQFRRGRSVQLCPSGPVSMPRCST